MASRTECPRCHACEPIRIPGADFELSRAAYRLDRQVGGPAFELWLRSGVGNDGPVSNPLRDLEVVREDEYDYTYLNWPLRGAATLRAMHLLWCWVPGARECLTAVCRRRARA